MSAWVPLLLAGIYWGLAVATVLTNQRLLRRLVAKRPDLVARHIPEAALPGRHPKKLFFFLRPSSAKLLASDQELLLLRNRLVHFVQASVAGLFLLLIAILVAMVLKL